MVRVWGHEKGEDFTCPHCGSIYEVEIHRFPMRDSDSADCTVCGKEMKRWNDTAVPVFKLKVRIDKA